MGNEREDLLSQCLESLKDEPITLHICEGIPGNLRLARANAIAKGTNEYIGWVDPDDFIIPGAYERLLHIIGDKKFAWAMEEIWDMTPDVSRVITKRLRHNPHHMHIIHRSLIDYNYIMNLASPKTPDLWVGALVPHGVFDKKVGYVWRNYSTSSFKMCYEHNDYTAEKSYK